MSMKSWKRQFYPVDSEKVREKDAIAHSLRKWRGLTRANLRRHGLKQENDLIMEKGVDVDNYENHDGNSMVIDGGSCALCNHFHQHDCRECPLTQHLGTPCDGDDVGKPPQRPYSIFTDQGDPKPMILALEACLKKAKRS